MAHDLGDDPRAQLAAAAKAERDARVAAAQQDPDLVWHYTDGLGLVSILTHHQLWATSSSFLNDQTEVALGLQLVAERVRELAAAAGHDQLGALADRIDQTTVADFGELSPARFFILSASQSWDSLAMWRNYGGLRESYAVGLDARAPLAVLAEGFEGGPGLEDGAFVKRQSWRPVAYSADAQRALVDAVFDEMPEQIARTRQAFADQGWREVGGEPPEGVRLELPDAAQELMDELEQALLLVKHPGFVDERETRYSVVVWEGGDPRDRRMPPGAVSYRATAYGIAPYVRLTGVEDESGSAATAFTATASHLPIRAVAISPSPNGTAATDSVSRLLTDRGYADLPVLRSGIPFRAG